MLSACVESTFPENESVVLCHGPSPAQMSQLPHRQNKSNHVRPMTHTSKHQKPTSHRGITRPSTARCQVASTSAAHSSVRSSPEGQINDRWERIWVNHGSHWECPYKPSSGVSPKQAREKMPNLISDSAFLCNTKQRRSFLLGHSKNTLPGW